MAHLPTDVFRTFWVEQSVKCCYGLSCQYSSTQLRQACQSSQTHVALTFTVSKASFARKYISQKKTYDICTMLLCCKRFWLDGVSVRSQLATSVAQTNGLPDWERWTSFDAWWRHRCRPETTLGQPTTARGSPESPTRASSSRSQDRTYGANRFLAWEASLESVAKWPLRIVRPSFISASTTRQHWSSMLSCLVTAWQNFGLKQNALFLILPIINSVPI